MTIRYGTLPSPTGLPASVAKLMRELSTLKERERALSKEYLPLRPADRAGLHTAVETAAAKADAALAADAARTGTAVAEVGTPNAGELEAERRRLDGELTGLAEAVQVVSGELTAAISVAGDKILADLSKQIEGRAERYEGLVHELSSARTEFFDAIQIRTFFEKVIGSDVRTRTQANIGHHPARHALNHDAYHGLTPIRIDMLTAAVVDEAQLRGRPRSQILSRSKGFDK